MGCTSSKSTPTVDTNPANLENLPQTLLNNGKSMMMKTQQDISDQVDQVRNDLKDVLSIKSNEKADDETAEGPDSPVTQRADRNDDLQFDDGGIPQMTQQEMNVDFDDEDVEKTQQALDMDATTEKPDTISDKPSTPMPEDNISVSNVGTDSSTAEETTDDSEAESIQPEQYSQDSQISESPSEYSTLEKTSKKISKYDNDTYGRLGRKLHEMENKRGNLGSIQVSRMLKSKQDTTDDDSIAGTMRNQFNKTKKSARSNKNRY